MTQGIFSSKYRHKGFYIAVATEVLGSEFIRINKDDSNIEDWSCGDDGEVFHLSVLGSDSPFNGIESYLQSWFGIGRIMQSMAKKRWQYQTDGTTYHGFVRDKITIREYYPKYRFKTWKSRFNAILEVALMAVRKEGDK